LQTHLTTWQSLFACFYKIILLPVCVCFHDTSVSVLQLQKRSLFAILVWKNSLDEGYFIHSLTLKTRRESRHQVNWCRSFMAWRLILLMEWQ
jgi:hypothetical protein